MRCWPTIALLACSPATRTGNSTESGGSVPSVVHTGPVEDGAAACEGCHETITASWRTSRHAVSAGNPIFAASLEGSPWRGWCVSCHDPRGADRGIDCRTCHATPSSDALLTSGTPSAYALAEHALETDPDFGRSTLCASCHEFKLPARHPGFSDGLVQDTVSDWSTTAAAQRGQHCQDCHMKAGDHGFPGAHSEDFVRGAIDVEVTRKGKTLVFQLRPVDAGHAVPTGDPFRRLELAVWASPERMLEGRWLAKTHQPVPWRLIRDDTLPADGRREVVFDDIADEAVFWTLDYRYGDQRLEHRLADDDVGYRLFTGGVPPKDADLSSD